MRDMCFKSPIKKKNEIKFALPSKQLSFIQLFTKFASKDYMRKLIRLILKAVLYSDCHKHPKDFLVFQNAFFLVSRISREQHEVTLDLYYMSPIEIVL